MHDVRLTPTERLVYDASDIRKPGTDLHAVAKLNLTLDAWRVHRANARRKLGIVVTERETYPESHSSSRRRKTGSQDHRWEPDPYYDETPREARARVARELAEGKRCCAPMLSGGPCSLLLPCATHGR